MDVIMPTLPLGCRQQTVEMALRVHEVGQSDSARLTNYGIEINIFCLRQDLERDVEKLAQSLCAMQLRDRQRVRAKRRRQLEQKRRLIAMGMDEEIVDKMNPKEIRDMVKYPKKVEKSLAAEASESKK